MTVTACPKHAKASKDDTSDQLERLANDLMRLGWIDEARRAREVAEEIRALRG